jgi:hypothetical protein
MPCRPSVHVACPHIPTHYESLRSTKRHSALLITQAESEPQPQPQPRTAPTGRRRRGQAPKRQHTAARQRCVPVAPSECELNSVGIRGSLVAGEWRLPPHVASNVRASCGRYSLEPIKRAVLGRLDGCGSTCNGLVALDLVHDDAYRAPARPQLKSVARLDIVRHLRRREPTRPFNHRG